MAYDGKVLISTKLDNSGFINGISGLKSSIKGIATAIGVAFSVAAIVNFGKESVKAASDMRSAYTGLKSIVEGQGRSFAEAKAFVQDFISDGLVPATNAVTAYKNLAMRGYDDKQIQEVMIALKNSSAYGRQASLTMGEAVSSATEGLKNENSILVDNAGVTKNVSMMWKDYAKSIGVGVDSLTQQQKIQAEVTGIMQETRHQMGDAAKVAGDYSGQVLGLKFAMNDLKVALGSFIIPINQIIIPGIRSMINWLTTLINIARQVTGTLFGTQAKQQQEVAAAASGAATAEDKLASSTKKAGKAAKGTLTAFDELNVLQQNTSEGEGEAAVGGGTVTAPVIGTAQTEGVLSEAAQRILDFLAPLQAISFDNLTRAFEDLKAAVKPLGKALFDGLKWAYDNIFVPFAKWTIEEAAPAFLDTLAKGSSGLSKALEILKPLGIWLWDSFLQPLAAWSGEWFIAMLDGIKKDFQAIGKWIGENQTAVQIMAITLGSFALAWGLVSAAVAIWNVVAAIAAGVTKAFATAVAFLTSPIGLVILAIGAVIAVAVLLTYYWDEIKAFALNCWRAIVECWNTVGEWFAVTVIQPLFAFFSNLWNTIKTLAATCWQAISTCWSVVANWFSETIILPVRGFFTDLWNTIKDLALWAWQGISDVWAVVSSWFMDNIVTPISSFFTDMWDGITKTFNSTWEGMSKGFKGYINGWLDLLEGFANFFVSMMNNIIGALNSVSVDIPEWVPKYGGESFGISIPNIPQIKLPRLAQGAVIPANREFAAILGDQRRGMNIEAPADLIRQIIREEGGAREISIHFEGSMAQLVRILKPALEEENTRQGVQLITGGI